MPKPKVADEDRRIVVSARVKPCVRELLMQYGSGNISRAIEDLAETAPAKVKEPEMVTAASA